MAARPVDFMICQSLSSPPWAEQPLDPLASISTRPGFAFGRNSCCVFSDLFCWQMFYRTDDNLNLQQHEAADGEPEVCRGRAAVAHTSDK